MHNRTSQYIDFEQLRREASMEQVLALVGYKPSTTCGAQWRGPCPIHKSSSPRSRSFSVNLERNAFQCFGCSAKGNQLDLAAALFGLSVYEAAIELCRQLGLEPPTK